jgi:hypothetical protein
MQTPARVALAVGGGYLLGRTKKLKLALTLGSVIAGRKLSANGLLGHGVEALRDSPEFDRLREQLTGAGRTAAMSAATSSLGRLSDRIEQGGGGRKRGKELSGSDSEDDERDEAADEAPEEEPEDSAADEEPDEEEDEPDEEPEPRKSASSRRRAPARGPSRGGSKSAKKSSGAPASRSRSGSSSGSRRASSGSGSSRGGRNG